MRAVLVATVVVLGLVGLARLGGGLRSAPESLSPVDAQATSVRRTVVAEAQRIIANAPTPTPTPPATPLPRPTCNGAIWWHEARDHLGEVRTVQGAVVAARPAPNGVVLLEVGQAYPDPNSVAVLAPAAIANGLERKNVCAQGRIEPVEGRATLQLRDQSNLVVLNP